MMIDEAQKLTWTSTSTGTVGTAFFRPGRQYAFLQVSPASTKKTAMQLQGSNSTSALWFNLTAATTFAAAGTKGSTVTGCFDRVRLVITASSCTSTSIGSGHTFWIAAR